MAVTSARASTTLMHAMYVNIETPINLCMAPTDNPTLQYLKDFFSRVCQSSISRAVKRFHHFIAHPTHEADKDSRRYHFLFADAARITRACTCNQERLSLVHIRTEVHTTCHLRFMRIVVYLNAQRRPTLCPRTHGYMRRRGRPSIPPSPPFLVPT